MNLRRHPSLRPPPSRRLVATLIAAATAALVLGGALTRASAGVNNYMATFYLSGAGSAVVSGANQLVTSQGASTTSRPAPTATVFCTNCGGNLGPVSATAYSYRYTLVDAGGETSPSTSATASAVTQGEVTVGNLPTSGTIRLYRSVSANGPWKRVVELTNSSGSYVDDIADASLGSIMPQAQTRTTASAAGVGFYVYAPGNGLTDNLASGDFAKVASRSFDGKGWVVDGAGGASFAAGTWTVTVKVTSAAAIGTARLDMGMWLVDDSGAVVGSPLIDPTCSAAPCGSGAQPGENTVKNIATGAGTAAAITTSFSLPAFSLPRNEHIYVEFWRNQTAMSVGTTISTLNAYDGVNSITHPAGNAFPDVPTLGSVTARSNNTTPSLSASYSDPDSDSGTVSFQLCSDAACNTVLQSSTTGTLASGGNGNWTPASLADGTYYWRAQSTDSASNVSGWSATSSFVIDTVPPGAPTFGAPASAVRTNSSALHATFVDSDATDSGTVEFQLCSNVSCSSVVGSSTSSTVGPGTAVTWTPSVADGTYWWRLRATDVAGNQTAWTSTQSFVLDTNPPATPTATGPANSAYLGSAPALGGNFSSTDTGDSGTINVKVCNGSCVTGSSASGIANGGSGTWTPTGLADGTYTWQVQAQDAAGNTSAWSASKSFTLDTTPPAVPTPSPSIAARVNAAPTLTSTYSDPPSGDSGSLTFDLCLDAGCTSLLGSSFQNGIASGGSASWTPSGLTDGTYYWRVTSTDSAGNTAQATGSFVLDTVAPGTPTLTSPAAAARVNSKQLAATFVDSDATDSGTVAFQLCSDAACATVLGTSTSATVSGGTGVTWTPGALADGTYFWRAYGKDVAGNTGAWSAIRSFVLDTNPPAVPTLGSVPSQVSTAPQLSATFSSSDVGDSGTILFQICGDAACTSVVASGSSSSGLASGASGTWTASSLAGGSYFWRSAAKDAAGNQSAWTATGQFTVDSTPPPVPATSGPADGTRMNQPPTLGGTYVDPSASPGALGSVTIQLCPTSACVSPLLSTTIGSLAAGAWGTWTPAIGDGRYWWRVGSADAAGNVSSWSAVASFVVDSTPPSVPVLSGGATAHVGANAALSARVDDPGDPSDAVRTNVELCADAACAAILATGYSDIVAPGGLASWAAPSLADGTYYWRALGEDSVGNRSAWSAPQTLLVDTVPPAAATNAGPSTNAVLNKIRLSGTYPGAGPGDSGTLEFELCADAACADVLLDGSTAVLGAGASGTWTPAATLDDGSFFWRVRAVDLAGNTSAWSPARSLVLDQTPPGRPQDFRAAVTGSTLTLRWKPPADLNHVRGYALLVDGRRVRVLLPTKRSLKIHLSPNDKRRFALASFDRAGNVSASTPAVPALGARQALRENPGAAAHRRLTVPRKRARARS